MKYIVSKYLVNTFAQLHNCVTFASTGSVMYTIKTAYGSFSKESSRTNDNTPSLPLYDAHLEGFFMPKI